MDTDKFIFEHIKHKDDGQTWEGTLINRMIGMLWILNNHKDVGGRIFFDSNNILDSGPIFSYQI